MLKDRLLNYGSVGMNDLCKWVYYGIGLYGEETCSQTSDLIPGLPKTHWYSDWSANTQSTCVLLTEPLLEWEPGGGEGSGVERTHFQSSRESLPNSSQKTSLIREIWTCFQGTLVLLILFRECVGLRIGLSGVGNLSVLNYPMLTPNTTTVSNFYFSQAHVS